MWIVTVDGDLIQVRNIVSFWFQSGRLCAVPIGASDESDIIKMAVDLDENDGKDALSELLIALTDPDCRYQTIHVSQLLDDVSSRRLRLGRVA
jgi:hypothetical protein